MKFSVTLFIIVSLSLQGFTQVRKLYITAKNELSNDPKTAVFYVLISKVEDSSYSVRQFDMRDTLMVQGNYKDSMMTIPNGRFFYYNKYRTTFKPSRYIDTNSYLKFTGFYLNGAKTGQWIEYFKRGIKGDIYTFENNKLNGLFQSYNTSTGNVLLEGNYVNDMKEGKWNTYKDDPQNPSYTDIYLHDKLSKKIIHLKPAMPPANYDNYLRKALKPYMDTLIHKKVIITISLNEQGIVENINQNKTMTPVIDKVVADAFFKSPKFQPSLYDNKQLKGMYQYDFGAIGRLKALQDAADQVINQKNMEILSRHANDIGRGLNNMGIGKPVN